MTLQFSCPAPSGRLQQHISRYWRGGHKKSIGKIKLQKHRVQSVRLGTITNASASWEMPVVAAGGLGRERPPQQYSPNLSPQAALSCSSTHP